MGWLNDPVVMQYSEQRHATHTLDSCRQYFRSFEASPHYLWAVELIGGRHIGNLQAHIDLPNQLAGISILMGHPACRGNRYGEEAFRRVCRFLFEQEQIRKITAGTMSVNIPMLKLMDRMGMVDDGIRTSHYLYSGRPVDVVYKALFQKDCQNLTKGDNAPRQ